jgi:hypothetical protein
MTITEKRATNEKKFKSWKETENGRVYILTIKGKLDWTAKYVKEVNFEETTISFKQEIYNDRNELIEIHEKFPIDKGHKKI